MSGYTANIAQRAGWPPYPSTAGVDLRSPRDNAILARVDGQQLTTLRDELFYGLSRYTKSFPDFSVPQKFEMVSPRGGQELHEEIDASMRLDDEYMLYIHLPFCHLECTFCNAAPKKTNGDKQRAYLESLLREIDLYARAGMFEGRKLRAIFFGGGTPTIYSNAALERILDKVRSEVEFCEGHNVTCEAHPEGLVRNDRIAELRDLGIHRISVGSQSFDPTVLRYADRKSHRAQVEEVVVRAREVGVTTNVDMMLGLPGQTLASVHADLEILTAMRPDAVEYMRHEIVNPLAMSILRDDPSLTVSDEELFDMSLVSREWIETHGYQVNGNFDCDRFFPFRYYWVQEMPFIGVGSRSRSYTKTMCFDTHEDLTLYSQLADRRLTAVARVMRLDRYEQMVRSVFLRMQLASGIDVPQFTARFGEPPQAVFGELFDRLEDLGCIEVGDDAIRLTRLGSWFVEDVSCAILDHALARIGEGQPIRRLPHSAGARSLRVLPG